MTVKALCIGCGCDDFHACWDDAHESPCFWKRVDRRAGLGVCSACPECVSAWDAGDRTVRVPSGALAPSDRDSHLDFDPGTGASSTTPQPASMDAARRFAASASDAAATDDRAGLFHNGS
ncbi:hypothetical protein [Burkholderia stagnalis]|uniref:hypothetical protein n=1 Tax=Burkholderia stagnalis TaxID=1503054 RepID=UPI0009C0B5F2|nr:hypothetical protein [Burkholderia stagnalis]MDY7806119.1 hypothetical protein [Burkholderia stagnalis]